MSNRKVSAAIPLLLGLVTAGCGGFGKVNQGRVIDYDSQKGLITLVADSNYSDRQNPKYDVLPPITIEVPTDHSQMGPAPAAGHLISLDIAGKRLVIFDPVAQALKNIEYTPVGQRDGVFKDDPQVAGIRFPVIDRERKTITIYIPRERRLLTFTVPVEYLSLPESTWRFGDEIRYYYKDSRQALRLMNITRTDLAS